MKVPRGKPRGIEPAFAPRLACRLKSADSPTSQIKKPLYAEAKA